MFGNVVKHSLSRLIYYTKYYTKVHTESTSAESSSFKDNPVQLLPRAGKSDGAPLELAAEAAPRVRPPLSLSPLFRESTDGHSWVLLRRLPSL